MSNCCNNTGPRIAPTTSDNVPAESAPILEGIKQKFGMVPNIFATLAHAPAALKMLTGIFEALGAGELAGKASEAIALRVSQLNGCKYCLAAHTGKAKQVGMSEDEIIEARKGKASCERCQAMLDLAGALIAGGSLDDAFDAARDAGVTEQEMLEVTGHTALNWFTNSINHICRTQVDFPAAPDIE